MQQVTKTIEAQTVRLDDVLIAGTDKAGRDLSAGTAVRRVVDTATGTKVTTITVDSGKTPYRFDKEDLVTVIRSEPTPEEKAGTLAAIALEELRRQYERSAKDLEKARQELEAAALQRSSTSWTGRVFETLVAAEAQHRVFHEFYPVALDRKGNLEEAIEQVKRECLNAARSCRPSSTSAMSNAMNLAAQEVYLKAAESGGLWLRLR